MIKVESYWSHTFLPELIRTDGAIFDFGVNDGGFSKLVAPRCRKVIGLEPDPSWNERLSLPHNVQLVPKALCAQRKMVRLHINRETCSSLHFTDPSAPTVDVEGITLGDALALEPDLRIDLLKMDIEGEEVPVLLDAPSGLFGRIVQMTVEFHDFLKPESRMEIRSAIRRMQELGFSVIKFSWHSYGDILFLNRRLVTLSSSELFLLRFPYKYGAGISRIIHRWRA